MAESDDDDWTPRPGEALPPEEAAPLLAAFERRFRVQTAGRHPKVPTWSTFADAGSRRAGPADLGDASLPDDRPVYLYFESGGREVRRTTMGDVRRYLAALEPWEDWDLYVFDDSLTWCLVQTHPQMGDERILMVAGAFPPPQCRPGT